MATAPINRVFAQYYAETEEQFEQSFDVGGLTSIPRLHTIRRMPDGNSRKYFTMSEGQPLLMTGISSVVSLIKKQKNMFDFLPKYREALGTEEAEQVLTETSALGTFMHILFAEICDIYHKQDKNLFIDFGEDFRKQFVAIMSENGVPRNKHAEYFKRVIKGAQSMYKFLVDYKVEVVAVEYCVVDFDNNICTPLDVIAYIQEPNTLTKAKKDKGEVQTWKERELVNLQLKFREKAASYPSDAIQANLETYIFNKYTGKQFGEVKRSLILLPKSHALADIGCNVVDVSDKFEIDDLLKDIEYAKTQKENKDLFFPDLDRPITNMGQIRIAGDGVHYPTKQVIRDFIKSFFD